MTSIYDQSIISELHGRIEAAQAGAERAAELAAEQAAEATLQRRLARQYSAMLAHAQGRTADRDEIEEQASRAERQRAALNVALTLLDAGLPDVFHWTARGAEGTLHLHLQNDGTQVIVDLESWAEYLGCEVTSQVHLNQVHHYARAVYLGVSVEVVAVTPHSRPTTETEDEQAGAVA